MIEQLIAGGVIPFVTTKNTDWVEIWAIQSVAGTKLFERVMLK
ncbi:MAG: hypothetical protein ABII26_04320 [Pseudomonadota bacterium]